MRANGLPHEAYGIYPYKLSKLSGAKALYLFLTFHVLKPNQRFGVGCRSHETFKTSWAPYALLRFVGNRSFNLSIH